MQRNKYFTFLLSGVDIVVILMVLIFLLFKPTQTEETLETEAVGLEQIDQKLLETKVDGMNPTGEELSEIEAVESESTEKTENEIQKPKSTDRAEIEVHEPEQTAKETPDTINTEREQPQYIGRIVEGYVEPKAEDIWPPERLYEGQLALKDTYQSNIQIILEELNTTDIDAYEWFKYTPESSHRYDKIYQWVCYAILTYYDGDVPCDYYVTLNDDIHNRRKEVSTIFEVQTRSEKPLNICMDGYNYKIHVEEGIKKQD